MAQKGTLRDFLESHKADRVWTHTSLAGGKYFIPQDDLNRFYDLYVDSILDQEKQYLTEKPTDIGPLRIDFDFIYPGSEVTSHQHTRDQVCSFAKAYMGEISNYLQVPDKVKLYIMEKRKPTLDSKKNRMKSGIHIVVPDVCTHKFVEQRVRRNLIPTMDEHFKGLPLTETWEKVYDEGVTNRSVPWTVYGSRKNDPNSLPYLVSYVLEYSEGEVQISSEIPQINAGLMGTLSLCRDDSAETAMTEEGKTIYKDLHKNNDVRISGGRAVTPARGRPAERSDKPGSRESSPHRVIIKPLSAEKKEYLKAHTMNLGETRYSDYSKWVQVGLCLHNIHPDLLDVFLDFSAQDNEKYNEAECISKWTSLNYRNDGERLSEKSLLYWSREDDPENYLEIEKTNLDRLIDIACSGTENDMACLIYTKFRDHYICADFGKNVWYRWAGHIWRETDNGIHLQLQLSRDIASMFFDKMTKIANDMNDRKITSCSGESKTDCGSCEYCSEEKKRSGLNKIYTRLKTTSFKTNVMRECRELFFDEDFAKKVDCNKNLIAFNNGVFDIVSMTFRAGKPEDYISFSTGIDYDPEKPYYEYESWSAVDNFIKQVLPDPEVRNYFVQHLSTTLVGGNSAQKFHIMTGSGSNGKSMIMNLTSTALGDYACTVPISLFTQKRKGSGNAAPEVIRLKGRRFVTMQEPDESIALNTGVMKEITSCEKMFSRDLFKSGVEFDVQAKFHLACNDKPKINTTDGGTWRRLVVINFISKFVVKPQENNEYPLDEKVQNQVNSKEWATPFLSYLVHVLKEGKGFHKLVAPLKVMEYTSEYRSDNDGIAKFVYDKISALGEGDEIVQVEKAHLKRVFKNWKDENDLRTLSPADLEKRIETLYGKCPRGGWTNFKLEV